jgi:hypothetical protein
MCCVIPSTRRHSITTDAERPSLADGDFAMVIIPWDQAADVWHRILQLARNHGDVR